MRRRLIDVAAGVVLSLLANFPAAARDENGDDRQAGAGVEHGSEPFVEVIDRRGDGIPAGSSRSDVVCRYYALGVGTPVDFDQAAVVFAETGQPLQMDEVCEDTHTGEYVSFREISWTPSAVTISADELAALARGRLRLPAPAAKTFPDAEHVVNLESWLWVDDWAPLTGSASAGAVSATVTAVPVSQRWVFGNGETQTCRGPGRPFDRSRRLAEQPPPTCAYTFPRSSAAESGESFRGSVTVTWDVTWTSNIGAGGTLGELSRSTPMTFRVAEVQAVNR